jgi:hypothetical protein
MKETKCHSLHFLLLLRVIEALLIIPLEEDMEIDLGKEAN